MLTFILIILALVFVSSTINGAAKSADAFHQGTKKLEKADPKTLMFVFYGTPLILAILAHIFL